jgi:hypothetical protein
MLWKLVVVGNECCREAGMWTELLRVLSRAQEYFYIKHCEHVIPLLGELSVRFDAAGEGRGAGMAAADEPPDPG